MSERPFLLFISRDEQNRHVLKLQGDGIPLTDRVLTLHDALRYARAFAQAAIEMQIEAERASKTGHRMAQLHE